MKMYYSKRYMAMEKRAILIRSFICFTACEGGWVGGCCKQYLVRNTSKTPCVQAFMSRVITLKSSNNNKCNRSCSVGIQYSFTGIPETSKHRYKCGFRLGAEP